LKPVCFLGKYYHPGSKKSILWVMGGLPDAVRTHYRESGKKEKVQLSKLLLLKNNSINIINYTLLT